MNVMLDDDGARTAVHDQPGVREEIWWGARLAAVGVALPRVEASLLLELLTDAWETKGGAS